MININSTLENPSLNEQTRLNSWKKLKIKG